MSGRRRRRSKLFPNLRLDHVNLPLLWTLRTPGNASHTLPSQLDGVN